MTMTAAVEETRYEGEGGGVGGGATMRQRRERPAQIGMGGGMMPTSFRHTDGGRDVCNAGAGGTDNAGDAGDAGDAGGADNDTGEGWAGEAKAGEVAGEDREEDGESGGRVSRNINVPSRLFGLYHMCSVCLGILVSFMQVRELQLNLNDQGQKGERID